MRTSAATGSQHYAWECVRIIKIATKVVRAGLNRKADVEATLEALRREAPRLAVPPRSTQAVLLRPGGRIEHVVDPRCERHDRVGALVAATHAALLTLAPADSGSPFPRYDNSHF